MERDNTPRKEFHDGWQYNRDKVDEMILALLNLTSFSEGKNPLTRAWKNHDWDALNRLHSKGYISDPIGEAKSIVFTEEGRQLSERLFEKYFASSEGQPKLSTD